MDSFQPTYLMMAAAYDDLDWMDEHAEDFDPMGHPEGAPSALMIAAEKGHAECAEILLRRSPEAQCLYAWSGNQWRAMELAVRSSRQEVVALLLPHEPLALMERSVLLAARQADPDMLGLLLSRADEAFLSTVGPKALLAAAAVDPDPTGQKAAQGFGVLLGLGAPAGPEPLGQKAARCVELLLGLGVPVGPAEDDYRTPRAQALFLAIEVNNLATVALLAPFFDQGALFHAQHRGAWVGRRTPLMWAAQHSPDCADFLLTRADERALSAKSTTSVAAAVPTGQQTALQLARYFSRPALAAAIAQKMLLLGMPMDTASHSVPAVREIVAARVLRAELSEVVGLPSQSKETAATASADVYGAESQTAPGSDSRFERRSSRRI